MHRCKWTRYTQRKFHLWIPRLISWKNIEIHYYSYEATSNDSRHKASRSGLFLTLNGTYHCRYLMSEFFTNVFLTDSPNVNFCSWEWNIKFCWQKIITGSSVNVLVLCDKGPCIWILTCATTTSDRILSICIFILATTTLLNKIQILVVLWM